MQKVRVFDGFTASDIEEEMNRFFSEHPQIRKSDIDELQLKMTQKYNPAIKGNETYIVALMMYSLRKSKRATKKK